MGIENYETMVVPVETGLKPSDHARAFDAYASFLTLPEEFKNTIVAGSGPERNRQAGYIRKKNAADRKDVFHYTDRLGERMAQSSSRQLPGEAKEFLEVAAAFHNIALHGLKRILHDAVEARLMNGIHFAGGKNNHHLRFVAYDQRDDDAPLAEPHYDMSTLTIAMCETHPGLRLGKSPGELEPYRRDPNQAVLFMGRGWLKLHESLGLSTDILPTWHDVVQTDELTQARGRRMAAILFANPTYLDTAPDMYETKKPLDATDVYVLEQKGVLAARESAAAA